MFNTQNTTQRSITVLRSSPPYNKVINPYQLLPFFPNSKSKNRSNFPIVPAIIRMYLSLSSFFPWFSKKCTISRFPQTLSQKYLKQSTRDLPKTTLTAYQSRKCLKRFS